MKSPHRLSLNVLLCLAATGLCIAALVVLSVVSRDALADWVVRLYGTHGVLSAEGWKILSAVIAKTRLSLAGAVVAGAVASLVVWSAERRAAESVTGAGTSSDGDVGRAGFSGIDGAGLVALMGIALAVAFVHARDSFYGDEMSAIVLVAPTSIAHIFGVHMVAAGSAIGNHILNSLLTHVMLELGFRSELALRAWSMGALAALVPCTYWTARMLKIPSRPALVASALVATSPTLARYGIAVRGYELAALFATMAIGFHACWLNHPRRRFSVAAGVAGMLGMLANIFTLPVFVALVIHTLFLPFDPRGVRRWYRAQTYKGHVTGLFGFFVLSIALHAFMLPHLMYGSVVSWTARQMSFRDLLGLAGAPLSPEGSPVAPLIGAVVLVGILVSARRAWQADGMRRTGAILLLIVSLIGLTVFVGSGQTSSRMVIYMTPTLLVILVREASPDDKVTARWFGAQAVYTFVYVVLCAGGIWWSASRPPLSRARENLEACEHLAAGRPVWTSTRNEEAVAMIRFYLPRLRVARSPADVPDGSTVYYRLSSQAHDEPMLAAVDERCRVAARFGGPDDAALYDCPDLGATRTGR